MGWLEPGGFCSALRSRPIWSSDDAMYITLGKISRPTAAHPPIRRELTILNPAALGCPPCLCYAPASASPHTPPPQPHPNTPHKKVRRTYTGRNATTKATASPPPRRRTGRGRTGRGRRRTGEEARQRRSFCFLVSAVEREERERIREQAEEGEEEGGGGEGGGEGHGGLGGVRGRG